MHVNELQNVSKINSLFIYDDVSDVERVVITNDDYLQNVNPNLETTYICIVGTTSTNTWVCFTNVCQSTADIVEIQ